MKLADLKAEVQKYQYLEDTQIIDVSLASIIGTRLKLGDKIWLVIIGASSGGKSQILRPLSLTDAKFLHRVDDLTENTFLSGMKASGGDISLLKKIGNHGMMVISDLTVLFSKNSESRNAILSQFRMIFDGEMTKHLGNRPQPEHWEGYLSVLAGSTPSIYAKFEEVADMGERFIYYRMKEYDPEKATKLALNRKLFGSNLDTTLSELYAEYLKDVTRGYVDAGMPEITLSDAVEQRIVEICMLAERIRTPVHMDFKGERIIKIPVPAMPMRVALQLISIAKALAVMRNHEDGTYELTEEDLGVLDWCGYSLANEEKRACLRHLADMDFNMNMRTQSVADSIGLSTPVTGLVLQNLASVGVVTRTGSGDALMWRITKRTDWETVRRIEGIKTVRTEDEEDEAYTAVFGEDEEA